jgi:LysR family glycine cleavage system transcriptional activator
MKRGRIPLTALRSFEAAGRNQSFTRAAQELFVSQAAISRQVRDLEGWLDQKLFDRRPQRVELTHAGASLLGVLTTAFDAIENGLSEVSERAVRSVVSVSVEPSFASALLVSRLKKFSDDFPSIEISVETDHRLVDFRAHEPQLAIRYGLSDKNWKNTQAKHLFDIEHVAVVAPGLIETGPPLKVPEDFLNYRLLHEKGEACWKSWLSAAGIDSDKADRGQTFDQMGLVLQSALKSQGAAILDRSFAAPYLESGELIQPFDISFKRGSYWVVASDFHSLSWKETKLVEWLKQEFGAARSGT